MSKGYILNKDAVSKEITYIEYETNNGFDVNPKNKVKKSDSINVSKVVFMSPTLIEKILNKKIDKKYKELFMLVGEITTDDDDDTGKMIGVLNELELFKSIIRRKYSKFMTEKQSDRILKRLSIMGKELRRRIYEIEEEKQYMASNEHGKSR